MKKIVNKSIIFLGLFIAFLGWTLQSNVLAATPVEMYDNVWRLINSKYVDQTNNEQNWAKWRHKYDNVLRTDEDAYVAIDTMVASLNDPYTKFLNPKEFQDETSSIKGSLKGIGIQIGVKDGKLMVIAPIEDTPAEKAGLLADDEILSIDGKSTKGITVDKAADQIRGEEGTKVTLVIKRKNVEEPIEYTITRAEIEIKSVTQKVPTDMKIPEDICYIRLSSFISRNAAKEVADIVNASNKTKKAFIIDLRSNPGGLLSNAIYISDMFINGGSIVSTVDRDGYKETQKASTGVLTTKPLVILLNKGSASASEIFSGAMKDNKRAVLVGTQSFGKGLVQEINKLPNNSGINITIQKYLTPSGTDIHKKGITPDVLVELTDEEVKNKDDAQLKKAIEVAQSLENGNYVVSK